MHRLKKLGTVLTTALPVALISANAAYAVIVTPADARLVGLDSLRTVAVPEPTNLANYISNRTAAIQLGKALFWDQQVGSDGQACASCHFHAGADNRVKNQLSPGLNRVIDPTRAGAADTTFGDATGVTASGALAAPNYTLNSGDFPFHQLSNIFDRNSTVTFDSNDVTSSQGTFGGRFVGLSGGADDVCASPDGAVFNTGGVPLRKVEPRNTPTVINAVFTHRNFWDGRANNIFNGLNPLGKRGNLPTNLDVNPGILVNGNAGVSTVAIEIDNASLASQAVGPPLSDFEMSCAGRVFADLGQKLLPMRALASQDVHRSDSSLRTLRVRRGQGLNLTYREMIQAAFQPQYWNAPDALRFDAFGEPLPTGTAGGYSQMEVNFSLFWGLAIQMYEATLVSDSTPFDRWMEGRRTRGFGAQELAGLNVFVDSQCHVCHAGPEFTSATLRPIPEPGVPLPVAGAIERMPMIDQPGLPIIDPATGLALPVDPALAALYDVGFYNIGVVPTAEDMGVGAELAGFPLSFARQLATGRIIDVINFDPNQFIAPGPIQIGERVDVDGAFKTPSLRNIELTGPYFHTGGYASLASVVEFYNRGGNRRDVACDGVGRIEQVDANGNVTFIGDTSGFDGVCTNIPPDIIPLGLTQANIDDLVVFLRALTDRRVSRNQAPFDHPSLTITNGHTGDTAAVVVNPATGVAVDDTIVLPATGGENGSAPIPSFLGL